METLFKYVVEHPASDWALLLFGISMFMLGLYLRKIFDRVDGHDGRINVIEKYIKSHESVSHEALQRMNTIENYIKNHESQACRRDEQITQLIKVVTELETLSTMFAKEIDRFRDGQR